MNYDDLISDYDLRVEELVPKYESIQFEDVHAPLIPHLPEPPASVLDIGAGSGRDASWFARQGFDVVAVEPSSRMLAEARALHPESAITWLQDRLPALIQTIRLGMSFDVIFLSAVWMHIANDDRARVFRKLVGMLKPGGVMYVSLRHGPHQIEKSIHPVSSLELQRFAVQRGLSIVSLGKSEDRLRRDNVQWETVLLKLPDDGTGALPILRHIIINDSKSSTYKLALLRTLVRIADGAAGLARIDENDTVSVPLGLVALYWIRLYKPLIENNVPQMPRQKDEHGLSFVKAPFKELSSVSPSELKVGTDFSEGAARSLRLALKDAASTIKKMPAFFTTYPNTNDQIFKVSAGRMSSWNNSQQILSSDFLWSLGEMSIPLPIWNALSRFAAWIEPSLIFEWCELMRQYSDSHGINCSFDDLMLHLRWLDPERDTSIVRAIVSRQIERGSSPECVWSGMNLSPKGFDVDHCFPFVAWPCNDLWNLLPARREVNNQKKDKLVSAYTLDESRHRIEAWWNSAYFQSENTAFAERFRREALASLIVPNEDGQFFENLFDALHFRRLALKQNQNLSEWSR